MTTLTLIGKPDCHLCDVAEQIVETVVDDLPADIADRVSIEHASIADDAELYAAWWEKIPVVLIDGDLHAHWRVSADRLRAALLAADPEGASA
ncbi:glutaredoxin family protein [Microbacterium sp.]|uniref:glutaredoxin family protein n=1 Tax=Microbacterium sp. TaxID=51671 RepID=UPI00391CEEF3